MQEIIFPSACSQRHHLCGRMIFFQGQESGSITIRIILELYHKLITTFFSFPLDRSYKKLDERIEIKNGPDKIHQQVEEIIVAANMCQLMKENRLHLFGR